MGSLDVWGRLGVGGGWSVAAWVVHPAARMAAANRTATMVRTGCMAFPPTGSALWSVAELDTADAVAGGGATTHDDRQLEMVGNVVAADELAGAGQPAGLGHRPLGRWGFTEQPLGDGLAGERACGRSVAAQPGGDQAVGRSLGVGDPVDIGRGGDRRRLERLDADAAAG